MQNLIVLAFPNETQAFQVRDALAKCEDDALLELKDAVVVTRDASGKVTLHQSADAAFAGASAGTAIGLIVGLLLMQPWVGTVVGLGVGAVVAALSDLGINDKFMEKVGATITPGTSAFFVLASHGQLDQIQKKIGPLLKGGTVLQTTVTKAREDEIRKMLDGK